MGALVGFVSEDTQNFLFLLTYTQKNATTFGKKASILFVSCRFSPKRKKQRTAGLLLMRAWEEFTKEEGKKIGEGVELSVEANVFIT